MERTTEKDPVGDSPSDSQDKPLRARDKPGTAVAMKGEASAEEVRWLRLDLSDEEQGLADKYMEEETDKFLEESDRKVRVDKIRRSLGFTAAVETDADPTVSPGDASGS